MAEVQSPPVASAKDTALVWLSVIALLGGIVAFYWYDELALPLRIAMVVAGLAAGTGLVWLSSYGREFSQFAIAARIELRKVVWPSREETIKTTWVVILFATAMGVFFWVLDMGLTYLTRLLGGQTG
jgi:preprotein translocase subunit SecE